MSPLKLAIASLGTSAFFAVFAVNTFSRVSDGPCFIDTSKALSQYAPLLGANHAIGQMEENVKERMRVFDDSISVVINSIETRDLAKESRLELLNMESNVAHIRGFSPKTNPSKREEVEHDNFSEIEERLRTPNEPSENNLRYQYKAYE